MVSAAPRARSTNARSPRKASAVAFSPQAYPELREREVSCESQVVLHSQKLGVKTWNQDLHATRAQFVFGFFVPYLDRLVILLPTPPFHIMLDAVPHGVQKHQSYQVHSASNQVVLHTRAILRSASSN